MPKSILVRGLTEEQHHAIRVQATIYKMTMAEYIIAVMDREAIVEPSTPSEMTVREPVREVEA